ncbi:GIY-YIG nuclease family protein [Bdellovibrio sp. SKB1291214]|uniref:GIY-YIG nuclease family protein n=1 Tax=Bdellovibrio sp. SKB1291214 TaxID=1732569 RepID=UPI0020CDF2F0|nr:GIY-YIG nuclease family protein [Bdellovibrio sp. SKB1291214]UYL10571.1 GIY-YIG nuclease family protein [Bdellovibrio sp. SKB1291214]
MKLTEMPLFFFDLQTTGAKPESGAAILEMAWTSSTGCTEASLIKLPNEEKIPYRIQMITGIFNDDMIAANAADAVFRSLEEKFANHRCVIHFAQFEKPFLAHQYSQWQKEFPFEILCTHEIAKRLFPNLPTRGIKGLAGYFGYPSQDLKRAAQQTAATKAIWEGLIAELFKQGIETWDQLQEWLQVTPKAKKTKYEYPLEKEKRLKLPDQPGVYRMISKWDEILYVGKATSLKDRVNSYFRGQKNRDSRKLEMLTQVYDLRVTVCGSPLEAALLETDEIKKWDPRYNISLKAGHRSVVFFNHEMTDIDYEQSAEFPLGPFSSSLVFDSIRNLRECLVAGKFHDNIFYEPIDASLVEEGFKVFCERNELVAETFKSVRNMLALGLWWNRQYDLLDEEASEGGDEVEEANDDVTATDIADKIERHIMRAGRTYLRAKELTKILNADISYLPADADIENRYQLKVRGGNINNEADEKRIPKVSLWKGLTIDTYDRMSVLLMELGKVRTQDGHVEIQFR